MKPLSEATKERDEKRKIFLALNEEESKVHYEEGKSGRIVVVEAPACDALASMLEIPDGWTLTQITQGPNYKNHGDVYVAYSKGERLTFFEDEEDYQPK